MKVKKDTINAAILLVFFTLMLWIGIGSYYDFRISHESPFGYGASDSYQYQVRIEGIKEVGNYRYEQPYVVRGYEDVNGFYPPGMYHLALGLSYAGGLEAYDMILFLPFFMTALASLLIFLIINRHSRKIAILSLPITILLFSEKAFVAYTFASWASVIAQLFILAAIFALDNIDKRNMYILFGIFVSAVMMFHTSEGIFFALFMVLYLIVMLLQKRLDKDLIIKIVKAAIISIILCAYFLVIFQLTWSKATPPHFGTSTTNWGNTPIFYLTDFKIALAFIIAGMAISLFFIYKGKFTVPIILGFSMIILAYGNYIGFTFRSFQLRFFWPAYLAIFAGIAIYFVLKYITKNDIAYYGVAALLAILFFGLINLSLIPSAVKVDNSGSSDPLRWEVLTYFRNNTDPKATVYFVYNDVYGQKAILRNTERIHYITIGKYYIGSLINGTLERYQYIEQPGDGGNGMAYRTGVFEFKSHYEDEPKPVFDKYMDICSFDYIVIDKVNYIGDRQATIASSEYNKKFAETLLKHSQMKIVFQNDLSVIIKNNNPGEACV